MKTKVKEIKDDIIYFDNGIELYSDHMSDCCEDHYLDMEHITIEDFEGLEFDLSTDSFFKRIEDYGIELIPISGHSVRIPGYGSNNGYYSSDLSLILKNGKDLRTYDITDCQNIDWY